MLKGDFSISFENSKAPLKITPRNTWVRLDGFKHPFKILELTFQTIQIDIATHPEAQMLQVGKHYTLYFLDTLGNLTFEANITVLEINYTTCTCQIPLYVSNEQILFDKLLLEIQKNDIQDKKFINQFQAKSTNSDTSEPSFCTIKTEEEMADILTSLVAQLPTETADNAEEKVEASILSEIPKSANTYMQNFFQSIPDDFDEESGYECGDDCEFDDDEDLEPEKDIHPLAKLRNSIVHKFLLDGLFDPHKSDSEYLEKKEHFEQNRSIKRNKKKKNINNVIEFDQSLNNFFPQSLLDQMQLKSFAEGLDKTNEYSFNLSKIVNTTNNNREIPINSELPPELVFKLANKTNTQDDDFVAPNIENATNEYAFSVRDEDFECVDGDEHCILEKLDKMLDNKRTIEFNLNSDENYIEETDEQKDQAFQERKISQFKNIQRNMQKNGKVKFDIDI